MKKLNSEVYNRLLAQAEEAKERGMHKLAAGILGSIGPLPEDERVNYSYAELQDDIYNELWKLANRVIKHYDVTMVDAEKVNEVLESFASKLVDQLEDSLQLENEAASPLDPKVPGES